MDLLRWLLSVNSAPDEGSGGESADDAGEESGAEGGEEKPKAKPKAKAKRIPDDPDFDSKLENLLSRRGIDPANTTVEEILRAALADRDEEITGRVKEREKRQIAEGKLGSALLEDILERRDIPADVRATVKTLAAQADEVTTLRENLNILAESGQLDVQALDLLQLSPKELKTTLALAAKMAGKKPAAKAKAEAESADEDSDLEDGEGDDEEAGASGLSQGQLKAMLSERGFGDGAGKVQAGIQQGKPKKQSLLDKYMPGRNSKDAALLDTLKEAADKRATVGTRR